MQLTKVKQFLKYKKLYYFNEKNISFNFIYTNSKDVKKNSILAVMDNSSIKKKYINEAIKKGATAILVNKLIKNIKINQLIVDDVSLSMKILLKNLFPFKPVNSIAVTGTNGKTSVVWYISQFCLLNKIPTKIYGTLGYYKDNKKLEDSRLTNPSYEILYQSSFLKKINKYNFIFEASSHGIDQNRIKDIPINIGALTNISQDHLDYHKTINHYKKTKFDLFTKYIENNGYAVLNDNIIDISSLKKKLNNKLKIVTFGKEKSDINLLINKNNLNIKFFKKNYIIKSIYYNNIDLENIGCAIACCFCLNIGIDKILKQLKKLKQPPGRSEKIVNKKNFKIYIDYAHTPDALKKILISQTFNGIKPNVLFGCGGNRDKDKRSKMGFVANKYANKVFITDDNPRNENPSKIRKHILDNCKKGKEIPGRKKAIFQAIHELIKDEILIIAGKGHEKYQIIKSKKIMFNDKTIIKQAVNKK